ncbi:MAG: aminomethyl-transferring glycine dehydrogenase subunit GcvPA [Bacillota bacterium]
MVYIPHTEQDRQQMLQAIGVKDIEELLTDIPAAVRLHRPLDLPSPLAEMDLSAHIRSLAGKNSNLDEYACFLGAGAYDHYVPKVVDQLLLRSEFYTAYTPYQPEISQGTLQAIFQYQSMICALTGMEVSNASMYDGASAMAEAALMACDLAKRDKIVISRSVHPEYRETVLTYAHGKGLTVEEIPLEDGVTSLAHLEKALDNQAGVVLVQHPNFFGCLEPVEEIGELARKNQSLYAACTDPISLGLLAPPGDYGADIVIGEGQGLGNHISFGGPFLGFLACREKIVRRLPGRIVGQTVDSNDRRGFVLTLQAREQHIRREKATSNICSNQALMALSATIYLSLVGPNGLRQVAELCLQKAHYLYAQMTKVPGVRPAFNQPFFKEFTVRVSTPPDQINHSLLNRRIIGGLDLGRFYPELSGHMSFCCTEKRTKSEIDQLVAGMGGGSQ